LVKLDQARNLVFFQVFLKKQLTRHPIRRPPRLEVVQGLVAEPRAYITGVPQLLSLIVKAEQ